MMPTARPFIGEEETAAVAVVLSSHWLGSGPKTQQFETAIREMIGCEHVVAVSSGTAALHLALAGFGIGPGAEVIVPSQTFCASVQAILATGATPVFAEVDPATLCLDVEDVRARITLRTQAVMPVHYGGQPCAMDALMALATNYDLLVIEDAAHAFGSTYQGQPIGTIGHATCFSFDPIKTITCGEGGAVTLHDGDVAERIRRMRLLGMSTDGYARYKHRGGGYEVDCLGYRYHMSDINAAIGLAQLSKFAAIKRRRREIWQRYHTALATTPGIFVLHHDLAEVVPFHFVIRVLDGRRDELLAYMREQEIGVGIHYPPNHMQPFFQQPDVTLPTTEALYRQILTLPLYPAMTNADVDHVVTTLHAGHQAMHEAPAARAISR